MTDNFEEMEDDQFERNMLRFTSLGSLRDSFLLGGLGANNQSQEFDFNVKKTMIFQN